MLPWICTDIIQILSKYQSEYVYNLAYHIIYLGIMFQNPMCQPTTAPSGKKTTSSKLSSTSVKPTSMRPTVPATKPNASLAVDGNVNKIPLTNLRHFSDYTITVSINVWGYVCAMTARCAVELLKPILKLVGFWGEDFLIHSLWNDRVHQLVATGGFPGFILVSRLEEAQVTQQQFIKFSRKSLSLVYTPGLKDTLWK